MKLKITLWIDDKDEYELTDDIKSEFKEQITDDFRFRSHDIKIKQIQIEETEFED